MKLLKKYDLEISSVTFTWLTCLVLISGGFFGLSTPSGSLFLRTEVNADFEVQVWRKSVKKNTHEFFADLANQGRFHTDSSVQELYIGIPQSKMSGSVDINFENQKNAMFRVEDITEKWREVKLPMDEIKIARPVENMDDYVSGYKYYKAPESVGNPSPLSRIVPGMNWALSFGVVDFFKLLFYSWLLALFVIVLMVKKEIPLNMRYLKYILPAIGFFYSGWLIYEFGVDMFWMDALAFPDLLKAKDQGTIGWGTFWAQHNEHRLILVRLLFLFLSLFKPFNMLFLSVMNQALILLGILYFVSQLKELKKADQIIVSLISTFLLFSPAHIENTILPFHGQWHGTVFGMLIVAGVYNYNKFFMKSIIFWIGFLVAYASMPPWVCIPMAILGVLVLRQFGNGFDKVSKKELIHFVSFGVITLLLFAYYMKGWQKVSVSPIDGIYTDPLRFILFFVQMVGNQVQEPRLSYLAGFCILSLGTYLFILRQKGKIQIPNSLVCLFLLSLSWCFITSIGRSTSGNAILPRYVFMSTGVWISVLASFWINRRKLIKPLVPVVVFCAVSLISLQSLLGYSHGGRFKRIIQRDADLVTKAVENKDPMFLKYSEIIPVFNLREDQGKRKMVLDYFLYMKENGYWSPVSN